MKLTKLQRYTAYCILLEEAEEKFNSGNYNLGLCAITNCLNTEKGFKNHTGIDRDIDIRYDLRELRKILDGLHSRWWFVGCYAFSKDKEGWEERIAALKACIEETHP